MLFPVNYSKMTSKFYSFLWVFLPKLERAVVVAELAERSLPTPKVRGLNPIIDEILKNIDLLSTVLKGQN